MVTRASRPALKRKESRYSWLLFFIPVIVIGALVLAPILAGAFGRGNFGTLIVEANGHPYHSKPVSLQVQATINSMSVTTPSRSSLASGRYLISFATVPGYYPVPSRSIPLQAGQDTYAVGDYYPIKTVIDFTSSTFNATRAHAVHGVTPVFWVNTSNQIVTLQSTFFGTLQVVPGGNATYIFQAVGTFEFWIYNNPGVLGTVTVS